RAVTYRIKQGFDHDQVALAVVVQAMVQSQVSGIMFTANPVSGDLGEVLINASWGLGEAIVSGQVTPDTYTVRKADGAIVGREIASKDLAIEYAADGGGTVERQISGAEQNEPALDDFRISELAALGQRIERHYAAPMDIEWGRANDTFYVLQARAITTLGTGAVAVAPPLVPVKGEFHRTMFVEIFPDPLSPSFLSVVDPLFKSMLDFSFRTLGFEPAPGVDGIRIIYSQPYFHYGYVLAALKSLSPAARGPLAAQVVNPFGRLEKGVHVEASLPLIGMALRLLRFLMTFPTKLPGEVARYRQAIREIEGVQLDKLSDSEIVGRVEAMVYGPASRLLNYDFLMILLIGITYRALASLLRRYFGDEAEDIQSQLISGITGNVTMETNKHIWDLSRLAIKSPAVAEVFRRKDTREIRTQLGSVEGGAEFLAALDRFLVEFGHREVRMDILYPTWGEDPTPILAFVRAYLDVAENSSPRVQEERMTRRREEMAARVKKQLARDPLGRFVIWPVFARILAETQKHTRERDTMHFELTRMFPPFRRYLLVLGRRWAGRGLIDRPEDVFFFSLDEMQSTAAGGEPPGCQTIQARRAEFEANKRRRPPSIIRDGQEIFPEAARGDEVEGQLRGVAGSPGRATGVARVIHGPEEFDRLQAGDILVAPLTNPVWTPLFAIAGGLVTEVGGILSHGAIVAREYGIPAVMAVGGATRIVPEGVRTTVDGSRGVVYLNVE
ncbi:MAG: PEP/pyruvate-binding domain-containing protein, partial [Rudaea sp.]